jgi:hypothetical protein
MNQDLQKKNLHNIQRTRSVPNDQYNAFIILCCWRSGKGGMGLFSVMNISTSGNLSYLAKPRPHIGKPECLREAKKLSTIGVDYSISR